MKIDYTLRIRRYYPQNNFNCIRLISLPGGLNGLSNHSCTHCVIINVTVQQRRIIYQSSQ